MNKDIDGLDFETEIKKWKKRHPIAVRIDNLFGGSLFTHAPHYVLTHPYILVGNGFNKIKWAWQRIFRGWDDRVLWAIDWYLADFLTEVLKEFKTIQHGYPANITEEDEYVNERGTISIKPEAEKREIDKWNHEIDKMIAGFKAARLILDYKYNEDEEYKYLMEKFNEGMKSFTENYFNLWD